MMCPPALEHTSSSPLSATDPFGSHSSANGKRSASDSFSDTVHRPTFLSAQLRRYFTDWAGAWKFLRIPSPCRLGGSRIFGNQDYNHPQLPLPFAEDFQPLNKPCALLRSQILSNHLPVTSSFFPDSNQGDFLKNKLAFAGENAACAWKKGRPFSSRGQKVIGWVIWVGSVALTAVVINKASFWLGTSTNTTTSYPSTELLLPLTPDDFRYGPTDKISLPQSNTRFAKRNAPSISFSSISRRNTCANGGISDERVYNLNLHVGALFLIFGVSALSAAFPVLAARVPGLRIPSTALFSMRHFGTGVLLATAYVHLLPDAFEMLNAPCLDDFWTTTFPPTPGAIALAATFALVVIEMLFSPARQAYTDNIKQSEVGLERGAGVLDRMKSKNDLAAESGRVGFHTSKTSSAQAEKGHLSGAFAGAIKSNGLTSDDSPLDQHGDMRNIGPLTGRQCSISRAMNRLTEPDAMAENQLSCSPLGPPISPFSTSYRPDLARHQSWPAPMSPDTEGSGPERNGELSISEGDRGLGGGHSPTTPVRGDAHPDKSFGTTSSDSETSLVEITGLTSHQLATKAIMQCFLLEAGILFHSIFIGMTLSVTIGKEFIVLIIAITFHQAFEGLALGSRIAELPWPDTRFDKMKPWLMALAFGCTAPLGQAIGLATHSLYNPESQTGLLVVGIMNSISAGLLLFASLVELLSEDFLSDTSFRILRGKRRFMACVLVFLGAFGMSLVGAWA